MRHYFSVLLLHISPDFLKFFRNGSAGAMEQNPVTLEERKVGVAAPKMFAFDNVFTDMDPQEEVANSALSDIITSGKCIFHVFILRCVEKKYNNS